MLRILDDASFNHRGGQSRLVHIYTDGNFEIQGKPIVVGMKFANRITEESIELLSGFGGACLTVADESILEDVAVAVYQEDYERIPSLSFLAISRVQHRSIYANDTDQSSLSFQCPLLPLSPATDLVYQVHASVP